VSLQCASRSSMPTGRCFDVDGAARAAAGEPGGAHLAECLGAAVARLAAQAARIHMAPHADGAPRRFRDGDGRRPRLGARRARARRRRRRSATGCSRSTANCRPIRRSPACSTRSRAERAAILSNGTPGHARGGGRGGRARGAVPGDPLGRGGRALQAGARRSTIASARRSGRGAGRRALRVGQRLGRGGRGRLRVPRRLGQPGRLPPSTGCRGGPSAWWRDLRPDPGASRRGRE
jgi:hypothetical protein